MMDQLGKEKIQPQIYRTHFLLFLVAMIFVGIFGVSIIARADTFDANNYVNHIPPVSLVHLKIKEAGIPADGVSGWPVERMQFKSETTEAQIAQAWDIVKNFAYEKELAAYEASQVANKDPLSTNFSTTAPNLTQDGQISVAQVNGYPYIYFQANGVTQHILGASSFEISAHETTDAISGEKMQVGDFVIGMIDQNLNNGATPEESSMHGIWVKWSSVKKQLIQELTGNGQIGQGQITGVSSASMLDIIASFGITIKDGITHIASLVTDVFEAKTARVDDLTVKKLQMIDKATGNTYCAWIENGQWQTIQGDCDTQNAGSQINQLKVMTPETPVVAQDSVREAQSVEIPVQNQADPGVNVSASTESADQPVQAPAQEPQLVETLTQTLPDANLSAPSEPQVQPVQNSPDTVPSESELVVP